MKILVTGATGFLGSHLCHRLINDGYDVSIFRRTSSDVSSLRGLDLKEILGDVTELNSVNRAVKGHDVVIHTAALSTCWRKIKRIQQRINVHGTQNIVQACRKYSVKRLIHVSSIAAIGIPSQTEKPADETFPFNLSESNLNYHLSKYRAEEKVLHGVREGLDAVIVNPSSIFGPYLGQYRGSQMITTVLRSNIIKLFRGGLSPVHISDVVDGIASALKYGKKGERYILSGENLSYHQMAETVIKYLNLKRRIVTIPSIITWAAAVTLEPLGALLGRHPPMTWDLHYAANRFLFFNATKAKRELGFKAKSFLEIVKLYLDHMSKQKRENAV